MPADPLCDISRVGSSVALPAPNELGDADARVTNTVGLAQIPAIVEGWDAAADDERARQI